MIDTSSMVSERKGGKDRSNLGKVGADVKLDSSFQYATILTEENLMSTEIRIDEELYKKAKLAAETESRSVPLQIAYWARIGKAALDNPDLPGEFIRNILAAKEQDEFEFFGFRQEE